MKRFCPLRMKSRVADVPSVAVKTAADRIVDFLEVCLATERCVFCQVLSLLPARGSPTAAEQHGQEGVRGHCPGSGSCQTLTEGLGHSVHFHAVHQIQRYCVPGPAAGSPAAVLSFAVIVVYVFFVVDAVVFAPPDVFVHRRGDDCAGVWTVPSSSGRKSASSPCSRPHAAPDIRIQISARRIHMPL